MFSPGVLRMFSNPRYVSSPIALHLRNKFLTVLTAASALPFAWLLPGLMKFSLKCHLFENDIKSFDVNWGPLSVIIFLGIPCRLNCCFNLTIMVDVNVLGIQSISMKLEV